MALNTLTVSATLAAAELLAVCKHRADNCPNCRGAGERAELVYFFTLTDDPRRSSGVYQSRRVSQLKTRGPMIESREATAMRVMFPCAECADLRRAIALAGGDAP